jgi:hypothetical protein
MRYQTKLLLIGLLLILITPPVFTDDGRVTGTLTLDGNSVGDKYAYAWIEPDFFHPNANVLKILISGKLQKDPKSNQISPAVELTVDLGSPSVRFGVNVVKDHGTGSIVSTDDKIIIDNFDQKVVEGRSFHNDTDNSWDITFSAPLSEPAQLPPLGNRLPADGGASVVACRNYLKALKSGVPAEIRKFTTDDFGKIFSSPTMRATILPAMKDKVNDQFQIISGFNDGKITTLFLKPDKSDDIKLSGIVKLVLMEGEWKVSADLFTKFF